MVIQTSDRSPLAGMCRWPRGILTLLLLTALQLACPRLALALEARVDRSELRQGETLQLTVSGAIRLDSAFNLFDLNTLNARAPDTTNLEQSFEILDRQQNYKVEIINNVNQSTVTWTYTLLPRQTGTLTIPPLELEDESTQAITVQVLPELTTKMPGERDLFIETELDQTSGYVQQQFIFTARLFYTGDLIRGELDHPDHTDALFRQVGKQREFSRYVGDRHYKVVERQYAVFPAKPGTLVIPALSFNGHFLDVRTGRRVARKTSTDPVELRVAPPPAAFSGAVWLPAQSYLLQETWSHSAEEIRLGETLTRSIDQQALGVEGVSLPPLPEPVIDGLKIYSEPPQTRTEETAAGLSGQRREVQMIVATRPGIYELPALSIDWWDVVNDRQRTATLPARRIRVRGEAQTGAAGILPHDAGGTAGTGTAGNGTPDYPGNSSGETSGPSTAPATFSPGTSWWLSVLLLAAWLATALGWLRDHRRKVRLAATTSATTTASTPVPVLDDLRRIACTEPLQMAIWLPLWLQEEKRGGRWGGVGDDALEHGTLRPLLNRLQALRYGQSAPLQKTRTQEGLKASDSAGAADRADATSAVANDDPRYLAATLLDHLEHRNRRRRPEASPSNLPDLYSLR